MGELEQVTARAILAALAIGKELEQDLDGAILVNPIVCPYCQTISETFDAAKIHDGECQSHPMAKRCNEIEAERDKLRGILGAQDERDRRAAERVGVAYVGCDTSDALADRIVGLTAKLAEARRLAAINADEMKRCREALAEIARDNASERHLRMMEAGGY